jgi:hypothetical protein
MQGRIEELTDKCIGQSLCLASAFTGDYGSGEDSDDQGEALNPEMQPGSIPQYEQ